jgi:hypothetical protein
MMTRVPMEMWDPSYRRLLLACFPKSGSTFLAAILAGLPGFRKVSLVPSYQRREQELDVTCLTAAQRIAGHFVAQHHVRYSVETQRLIDQFVLHPIVLVRNIDDVVASVRDHLKTGGTILAQAYVPPDLPRWHDAAIEQFIADMLMPWYFNFYASWAQCPHRLEVTYENLIADPASVARLICHQADIAATDAQIGAALAAANADRAATRFNVGISGRGKQISSEAGSRIRALAGYYSFLDLSALGL